MKYAIINLGGKQLKITEGYTFDIERQQALDIDVLYYTDGKEVLVGDPILKNVKVKAHIESEKRGNKVRVARFRSKSRYHKVKGHKQPLSVVKIDSIEKGTKKKVSKEEK